MSTLDIKALRDAFGSYMTGVTVVTAIGPNNVPVGFAANSFTSVSMEPPLLLVCPAKSLSSFDIFDTCDTFAISVLAEDQRTISNIFASPGDDRFGKVAWHQDAAGNPLVDNAIATFSCTTHDRIGAGDHHILIGQVTSFAAHGGAGLGYSNNGYFSLGLERKAAELPQTERPVIVGAIIEQNGQVLMVDTPAGLQPPATHATSRTGSLSAIRNFLFEANLEVEFGPVYSVYEDKSSVISHTYYRGTASNSAAGNGRYVDVRSLAAQQFASPAIADMMNRFAEEWRSGLYSLYVGDETEGEVHLFGEGNHV